MTWNNGATCSRTVCWSSQLCAHVNIHTPGSRLFILYWVFSISVPPSHSNFLLYCLRATHLINFTLVCVSYRSLCSFVPPFVIESVELHCYFSELFHLLTRVIVFLVCLCISGPNLSRHRTAWDSEDYSLQICNLCFLRFSPHCF